MTRRHQCSGHLATRDDRVTEVARDNPIERDHVELGRPVIVVRQVATNHVDQVPDGPEIFGELGDGGNERRFVSHVRDHRRPSRSGRAHLRERLVGMLLHVGDDADHDARPARQVDLDGHRPRFLRAIEGDVTPEPPFDMI